MSNLTEKEIKFIEELKKDYEDRGDQSFISTVFLAIIKSHEELKRDVLEIFEGYYGEIFNNSDFIMESMEGCYIGKYKDDFWGTGSEGELYGLGKEIQNIPFRLMGHISNMEDDLDSVINYFSSVLKVDYFTQIEDYKKFCAKFGMNYTESYDYINAQSKEFDDLTDKFD